MPGFMVSGIGDPTTPGDSIQSYYTYTWTLPTIFGQDGSKQPLIYLKEMGLPTFSVGQERVRGASLNYKYASDVTWDDVKVVWYDTVGMLGTVQGWRKSVWTEDTGIQPATSYKMPTSLATLLPDGTAMNEWDLQGSWPSSIRHGDLTYAQSDVKIVDVTITYDWANEVPSGGS